ncbi:hypothetical protein PspLS_11479 [Pyricularia sp. CBS 133598]|nr:hypothetical protein PspLS_11479 [Pyricularia sp. CBS 133598]
MASTFEYSAPPLPYYCDPQDLPGPLPTFEEIHGAETVLPCMWSPDVKRIVVVRDLFVVKYGATPLYVDGNEGHALLVLRGVPTVPKLYAMYRQHHKLYLVMQHLPGMSLDGIWGGMTEGEKTHVIRQLREILTTVRSLSPPPVFGSVACGPVPQRFFKTPRKDSAITGPFADEAAFHAAMGLNVDDQFLARHLPFAMGRHDRVLTHGDLQRKNILVVEAPPLSVHGQLGGGGDDNNCITEPRRFIISGIVDWEEAGWMPSYWEFASIFMYANWSDDWTYRFDQIVNACLAEGSILMVVRRHFDGF